MKVKDILSIADTTCKATNHFTDEEYGVITDATASHILNMKVQSVKRKKVNGAETLHIFAS